MATQTLEQFGQSIKAKYPQYKDIPDADLGQKMIDKYPQYKDMVSTTATPTATATPKWDDAYKSKDFIGRAEEVIGNVFPGRQVGEAIGTLGGYGITALREKTGNLPKGSTARYDTSAPSPLQVAGDVAKGATLVGGLGATAPTTVLGGIAQGAGYGALGGAGAQASKTSGSPIPTLADINQVSKGVVQGGITGGAIAGATSLIGKLLERAGDKIIYTAIKPSQADVKDGFSIDTIKKYDLGGSLSTMYDKTEAKMNDLSQQLNDYIGMSDTKVDLNGVYDNTIKSLGQNNLRSFGSNTSVGRALEQLDGEIQAVSEDGILTVPQAQIVKQASGKFGAWQFGIPDPESTARQTVYNSFYHNLKTAVEDASPEGVDGINKSLSELIPVQNAIIRRIPVAERNSALSLTDMMTLTASLLNPHALVGLGISVAQKEGAMGNLLMKLGPKLGSIAPELGIIGGNIAGRIGGPTK